MAKDISKIDKTLKMTSEDAQMIMELRNDLTKVYNMLEQSKEKEEKQRHLILNLKAHIDTLKEQLHQMSTEKYGQSNTLSQVLQDKEKLNEDKSKLETEMASKDAKIKELTEKN